jgi:ATP-binding cassette subfamily A (ABC1) protein 3
MSFKERIKTQLCQLWLLLWKNFLLQKRSVIGTILELTIPAIFAIILLPIRSIVKSDPKLNDTIYDRFPINSLDSYLVEKNFSFGYSPNNIVFLDKVMLKMAENLNLDWHNHKCKF